MDTDVERVKELIGELSKGGTADIVKAVELGESAEGLKHIVGILGELEKEVSKE